MGMVTFTRILARVTTALVIVLFAQPAAAQKVRVFAAAEGATITGYVYFGGGARARGAKVTFLGPDGAALGEAVANEAGNFSFQARIRVDHRIVVDAGQGHRAEFTLATSELPETLPTAHQQAADQSARSAAAINPLPTQALHRDKAAADLEALLDKAVARQIRPLREQLNAYEDKVRWHDVLGGIGYIVGIAGVSFYILGRRRPPSA